MSEPSTIAENPADAPFQFSLRSLLVLQAVFAVFLALLVTVQLFAVVLFFVVLLIYCRIPPKPGHALMKRVIVDACGGVILPLLCFAYDPFVLEAAGRLGPFLAFAVMFQVICLTIWLVFGRRLARIGSLLAGVFVVGSTASVGIGVLLLPFSIIGLMFFLVGLLGFVPLMTGTVLARNAADALRQSEKSNTDSAVNLMWLIGFAAAIVVPLLMAWLFGDVLYEIIEQIDQVQAFDRFRFFGDSF